MATASALAAALERTACRTPQAVALHHGGHTWSHAALWAEIRALAAGLAHERYPLARSGDSLELARHAWASSLAGRAFWPLAPERRMPPASGPTDVALIISTSGSEGEARAVLLGERQLSAAADAANARLQLQAGDLWLNCLPLFHIGGQAILWRCARAAAAMLLHEGFHAPSVADDLRHHPVTHISLVPAMLAALLELGVTPPPSMRVALIGGAALARPLYDKAKLAGWPLWPSYGMSETAALLAAHGPDDGPWCDGLVGQPLPGMVVAIGDDGRIRVRGEQLMQGYLGGDGLDPDGWLTTGDLGWIGADGGLTVTGRADDMLISGGRNIHPQEIESCLAACPGVDDVAVSARPDPTWGDLIVALVVGSAGLAELQAHARQRLPSAGLPRRLVRLERIPRNASGKPDRRMLRRLACEGEA